MNKWLKEFGEVLVKQWKQRFSWLLWIKVNGQNECWARFIWGDRQRGNGR